MVRRSVPMIQGSSYELYECLARSRMAYVVWYGAPYPLYREVRTSVRVPYVDESYGICGVVREVHTRGDVRT
jgi:hypothetical protein